MARTLDVPAAVLGSAAVLAAAWTVGSGVGPASSVVPPVLVPGLFVLAGVLGPLWSAARFTCRLLIGIGALHLFALAGSAAALVGLAPTTGWHAVSLVLYVAGFGLLLPLAAGYPDGPAPRVARGAVVAACVLPVLGVLAAPTPSVLQPDGPTVRVGPVAALLPAWVASASAAVFLVPVVALVVLLVRFVRGDRELRGRLVLPFVALAAFALLVGVGAALPSAAAGVADAVFLVSAPLIPVGLVAGSRALAVPVDERPALAEVPETAALDVLTPRENDVLALMARGESNAAIARSLHISLSAVEKHTTSIFGKLQLTPDPTTHRRVAAVVAYLRSVRP